MVAAQMTPAQIAEAQRRPDRLDAIDGLTDQPGSVRNWGAMSAACPDIAHHVELIPRESWISASIALSVLQTCSMPARWASLAAAPARSRP